MLQAAGINKDWTCRFFVCFVKDRMTQSFLLTNCTVVPGTPKPSHHYLPLKSLFQRGRVRRKRLRKTQHLLSAGVWQFGSSNSPQHFEFTIRQIHWRMQYSLYKMRDSFKLYSICHRNWRGNYNSRCQKKGGKGSKCAFQVRLATLQM